MIHAEHLVQNYGNYLALNDVSFEIPRGQVVGLVGPNGAGKTTTMKILTGYLAPTSGRAQIAGKDIVEDRLAAQRHVGYLPENAPLYKDMPVQDYLLYMARLREVPASARRERLSKVVEACDLWDVLAKPIGHLSKGFRQRVGLAQALVHDPDILILDEPTSGLDPNQILDIRDMIRGLGQQKTVILSTHILSEVEATCDRALMIVAGRLHVDEPMETFRRGRRIRLEVRAEAADLEAKVSMIAGVQSARATSAAGSTRLILETDGRDGLLEEIGSMAHDAGWPVTELAREQHDLEDIFRVLKEQEGALS